jgi:hypothetical protein
MSAAFGRDALLDAFDQIGRAAVKAGTKLQIAVYGGSALMLASNFRFATEDVDISEIGSQWPDWLSQTVVKIAQENDWSETWLNDAASQDRDHLAFGTFPRRSDHVGLCVLIPSARYMLALKLKSLRISDFDKGAQDMSDAAHLLRVLGLTDVEQAIEVLAEFFPRSAANADKQRFVLKRLFAGDVAIDAPQYPRTDS